MTESYMTVWIAVVVTVVVLSAFFRESSLFRAVESYFIGLSASLLAYYLITDVLNERVFLPLAHGRWSAGIALLLMLPVFFRKVPVFASIAPWIVAVMVGVFSVILFVRVADGVVVRQILFFTALPDRYSFVEKSMLVLFSGVVATTVLYHFIPSRKDGVAGKIFDRSGVFFTVVALGVLLGYTVASYATLFVDRVYFLFNAVWSVM